MSSPSKAVDVLDWIRIATTGLNCLCEGSPAAKRGIVVRDAVAELIAAADRAAFQLEAMAKVFGDPRFTDRHGDGPACAGRAAELRAAIREAG